MEPGRLRAPVDETRSAFGALAQECALIGELSLTVDYSRRARGLLIAAGILVTT